MALSDIAKIQGIQANQRAALTSGAKSTYNFLEQNPKARGGENAIFDEEGIFATSVVTDKESGVTTTKETGFEELFSLRGDGNQKYAGELLEIANATKTIRSYKDSETGEEIEGKVAGVNYNKDSGTYSLIIDTPQGFFPKTFGFSNRQDDQVVTMTKEELKDFMQLNLGVINSRANSQRGLGESTKTSANKYLNAANVMAEVDDDPNLTLEEKGQAFLELQQLVKENRTEEESNAINSTSLGIDKPNTAPTSDTPVSDTTAPISNLKTPPYTLDTSTPEAAKALALVNQEGLDQTILSKGEIDVLSQGLSKGFRKSFTNAYSFNQTLLNNNAQAIAELEGKENITPKEQKELTKLKTKREKYLLPGQEKLINRVKDNIANDSAAIETAKAKEQEAFNKKLSTKEKLLANPNLSEARKKELQAEVDTFKKSNPTPEVIEAGTEKTFNITSLPKDFKDPKALNSWVTDNQVSLKELGQDEEVYGKVVELVEKFGINSQEDIKKVPWNTPEAYNMDALAFVAVMAGRSSTPESFMANYQNLAGTFDYDFSKARTAAKSNLAYRTSVFDLNKKIQDQTEGYDDKASEYAGSIIEILYPTVTSGKNIGDSNEQDFRNPAVATRIGKIINVDMANSPTTPKFGRNVEGKIVVIKGTPKSRASLKNTAGLLFKEAVKAEGSADIPDWFDDVFTNFSQANDLGAIMDRIKYDLDESGNIREIYYADSNGNELDGSLKLPEIKKYFGGTQSYIRQSIMAFASERKQRSE